MAASLHFLPFELPRWDALAAPGRAVDAPPLPVALALGVFTDERPLRGAAGLCDWRLCGRLSRLLKKNKASGAKGETVLMPPGKRLRFGRILLFGLGRSNDYDEARYRADIRWIRKVAADAAMT